MKDILIKNAHIVTMDGSAVYKNGCVLISGSTIKYVGDNLPQSCDAEVIDARGGIVMPGLVNAHTHLGMSCFRSFASDLPLDKWLEQIFKVEDKLNDELIYQFALIACAEALERGGACVNDMYLDITGTAEACLSSGIRAYVSRNVVDTDGPEGLKRRLKELERMHELYDGKEGRLHVLASAHAEYTCSENAVKEVASRAKSWGSPFYIHASETVSEVKGCLERHGVSPIKWLAGLGLPERTIAAHCVVVSREDMQIMLEHNIIPVHNSVSNLKLASGIAPVKAMLETGIKPALGTDGNGSNNNLDMFREIFTASILQKGFTMDAQALDAYSAVKMATVNGADALGYKGGMLKEGYAADVLVLYPSLFLQPVHDVYGIIAYSAESCDVRYNIVNGRILVKEGECLSVDKERCAARRREFAGRLF